MTGDDRAVILAGTAFVGGLAVRKHDDRQQHGKQRCSSHDLPGLAIPALWDLFVNPRLLQGNLDFLFQSFNRGDIFACHCRNRS